MFIVFYDKQSKIEYNDGKEVIIWEINLDHLYT